MARTPLRCAAAMLTLALLVLPTATQAKETPTVDINKATIAQLVELPGVGEAIARRIVEFREQNGPFKRVDDLLKVKGIGEKSLEKLRPYVRVETSK